MVNLLGDRTRPTVSLAGVPEALAIPDTHLHLYGKREVRARRKLGHLTAVASTVEEAVGHANQAHAALSFT
jgi:5-(carboxyamino)imidazole ribonucleotide synthase